MQPDSSSGLNPLKIVTKIESQKRKSGRISIFLDNEFAFGVSIETFNLFRLSLGQELTDKQIVIIQQHELFEQAKESAVKYLALRIRSQKELSQYLLHRKKYPPAISAHVIQYCLERDYLNDQLFCEVFIRDQLNLSRNGVQKIRRALIVKGIEAVLINDSISRLVKDEDQLKVALNIAKKKALVLKNDPKLRAKLYRFLIQKGYKHSVVRQVIQKII
ncbi:MAG: RecX family transcriptional regulator [Candidatus Marinimicrobia bacterium]|nr:RecX family transcriptional regulator [Candidatus Neomarinimicrobiota bacterium]MCK9482988.1 RecX family transcriptional regulator [Candidatus Neomarinimicrobiota bacterium]MCK9558889.1 RecX family transcriptional regulator [Candidatus Neomarinimicrobiota bacterium]MDD5230518.1 RecX family transcriptional regulator [Candidatus Neomarinimicrobiota bacterium]